MLIAPVFEKGATSRAMYLPTGTWYDWWTNVTRAGGQTVTRAVDLATMPILSAPERHPVGPRPAVHEPGGQRAHDAQGVPCADGQYTLYEDDGISQDYLAGEGAWTRMTWNERRTAEHRTRPGRRCDESAARRTFNVELIPKARPGSSGTQADASTSASDSARARTHAMPAALASPLR